MTRPSRPVLVYDGDCRFCSRWVERWKGLTGDRVDYETSIAAAARFPEVPPEDFARAVQLIEPDRRSSGALAVFRTLSYAPHGGLALRLYERLPLFAAASEKAYAFVARRREPFSRLTAWLWGEGALRSTYAESSRLFRRVLGGIYFAAFVSLGVQVAGLAGRDGILPMDGWLAAARSQLGAGAWLYLPSVCWLSPTDACLRAVCWTGAALSWLVIADLTPGPVLTALWALYLSLVSVGRDFLSFQWDMLLLETGFLAIFLAPWRLKPLPGEEPPALAHWLLRWLLFRLMFESGCVKLTSGDATWRGLTALTYHFQTQPLPTRLAWHVHQLPAPLLRGAALSTLALELAVPFAVFLPRRPRNAACGLLILLQALIAATGNYAYFNALTAALCLLLLDDVTLGRAETRPAAPGRARRWATRAVAAYTLSLSSVQLCGLLARPPRLPKVLAPVLLALEPFRLTNSYGLFAVMTTSRPEIAIEGSADGVSWREYRFRYKPGDLARAPRLVAPHQPRLDWQMWFAALGSYQDNPWLINLLARLLQGSPEVLRLFAENPFPEGPPRYARALVYDYRFTTWAERRATGRWWERKLLGPYCPPLERRLGP